MNLVMTEETLPLGESLLLPPWPGCAGHVKRSYPALLGVEEFSLHTFTLAGWMKCTHAAAVTCIDR